MNHKTFINSFFKIFNLNSEKIEFYSSTFSESFPDLFSLKKFFLAFEKIESFFLKEIKKQTEYEFNIEKSLNTLNNVSVLLVDFIEKNNKEIDFYSSSLSKNQKMFIDNVCFLQTPCFVDSVSFQIDSFDYNSDFYFELLIDKIVDGTYVQDKKFILPYHFSGIYFESLIKNKDFISKFEVLNNFPIIFKNTSNDIINVNCTIKDGRVFIDKNDIFYDTLQIFYEPTFESSKVKIEGELVKVTLNTNFSGSNNKKLILLGADYNV